MLKLLSDKVTSWWWLKKKLVINILIKEIKTVRVVTDNVTAERKQLPKLNILSYHNILFLFPLLFWSIEIRLKNSNSAFSSKLDEWICSKLSFSSLGQQDGMANLKLGFGKIKHVTRGMPNPLRWRQRNSNVYYTTGRLIWCQLKHSFYLFLLWSVFQLKSQVTDSKFDLASWVLKIQNNSTKEQN